MPNPIIRIHNAETNEVIDREMTAEELEKYEADIQDNAEKARKAAEEAAAKEAILERLGITADEAALLLG